MAVNKYKLRIFANDGSKEIKSIFIFEVTNKAPVVHNPI